jgi:hypothetical protein
VCFDFDVCGNITHSTLNIERASMCKKKYIPRPLALSDNNKNPKRTVEIVTINKKKRNIEKVTKIKRSSCMMWADD